MATLDNVLLKKQPHSKCITCGNLMCPICYTSNKENEVLLLPDLRHVFQHGLVGVGRGLGSDGRVVAQSVDVEIPGIRDFTSSPRLHKHSKFFMLS